jgi:hypothetical protein
MIDLHYWPTPNGWKISIMLEECGLPYHGWCPVNIGKGEQFAPEFLAISPNNRMPAIVDHAPAGGGAPVAVFESGAILLYLAEKTGRFLPTGLRERYQAMQWLMWQMGGWVPWPGKTAISFCTRRTKSPTPSNATARRWTGFTACSMRSWRARARMWPAPITLSPTWPSSLGAHAQGPASGSAKISARAALVRRLVRAARRQTRAGPGQGASRAGPDRRGAQSAVRADRAKRARRRAQGFLIFFPDLQNKETDRD